MILRTSLAQSAHKVSLSLNPRKELEANWIPRPNTHRGKSRSIHRTPLLSPQWGGEVLPIKSLANILREQPDSWPCTLGTRVALAACMPTADRTKLGFFSSQKGQKLLTSGSFALLRFQICKTFSSSSP